MGSHELEREVDPGGHTGGGPDPVVDVDLVGFDIDLGMPCCQIGRGRPVGGGATTVEDAGLGQEQRAAADRADLGAARDETGER
ncbi:MAG: hypothetical protein R2726_13490 [Acidimicrobiales bacterium]